MGMIKFQTMSQIFDDTKVNGNKPHKQLMYTMDSYVLGF